MSAVRCSVLSPSDHRPRGSLVSAASLVCVVLSFVVAPAATAAPARSSQAGEVQFVKDGGSELDRFTAAQASGHVKGLIRRNYSRMVVFSPYFDLKLRAYRRGWVYKDLYGMFPDSQVALRHPEWILRGSNGEQLFIPFDCAAGSCPQYAGDITNPAFRRWWIRGAKRLVRRGYPGIYIDDVNMMRRVALGTGVEVTPRSGRSGKPIGHRAWRRAVARFTQQIRRALPRTELVHNVIWFAPRPRDAISRTQLKSADVIALERGVNDTGLTRGGGQFGLLTLLRYIDMVHRRGRHVLLDDNALGTVAHTYGLAGYFMVSRGGDFFSSPSQSDPLDFWSGYRVRLGAPKGRRVSRGGGLLRRDFARGRVLLNQPGSEPRRVRVPAGFRLLGDRTTRAIALGPASAAILVRR